MTMKMLDVLDHMARGVLPRRQFTRDGNRWILGSNCVKCTSLVNALMRRGYIEEGTTSASRNQAFLTTMGRDWYTSHRAR